MTNLSDVQPEENSNDGEIESPVEGPKPNWLKAATSTESSFDENKAPDWLRAIRAGKGPSTPDKSSSESVSAAQDDDDGMSDLERLLAEEGIDLNTVSEHRPEEAQGMSAKEWLISTSGDDLVKKRLDDTPFDASPPPSKSAAPTGDQEMSDIERLLAEEGIDLNTVAEERPEEAQGMSAKDWLISTSSDDLVRKRLDDTPLEPLYEPSSESSTLQPAESVTFEDDDKMVVSDDLPDWLQGIDEESEAALSRTPEPAARATDSDVGDDLPDWLQDMSHEEELETAETPSAAPAAAFEEDDRMVMSSDLPDWLQEVDEEEPDAGPPMAEPTVAARSSDSDDGMVMSSDLPDWLQEVDEEEPDAGPSMLTGEAPATSDDLPDWLRDVEQESSQEYVVTNLEVATSSQAIPVEEDELPAWLRQAQEDGSGEVTLPDDEVESSDVPDWLKRVQAEQDEATSVSREATIPAEPAALSSDKVKTTPDSDVPDWVKEVPSEEDEVVEVELPKASPDGVTIDEGGLPDWLQEVDLEEDDDLFEPSEPSPDPFDDIAIEEMTDLVDEEGLPDWLQEVQREAAKEIAEIDEDTPPIPIAHPSPVASAKTDKDSLIDQEGLPDWLKDVEAGSDLPGDAAEEVLFEPLVSLEEAQPMVAAVEAAPEVSTTIEEEEQAEPIETSVPLPVQKPATTPTEESVSGLPDWLRKLRQGSGANETPQPQPVVPVPAPPLPPQPAPLRPAPVAKMPPPPQPVSAVATLEGHLQPLPAYDDLPGDATERLRLAQTAHEEGNLSEAIRIYNSLVAGGAQLDVVIEHTKQAIKLYPNNALLYQVMGDAMMRDGRLQSALEAYRAALANL